MPWISDTEYVYTPKVLDAIALGYESIYSHLDLGMHTITIMDRLVEYKADFDLALSSIGRGYWDGLNEANFMSYSDCGRWQRVIIARIRGINDYELQSYGFYQVPQARGAAYSSMCKILNGEDLPITKARKKRWRRDKEGK